MARRAISLLHPVMQDKARRLRWAMNHLGCPILIYCTYRSIDEQNECYAQGRTESGRIVTWAKGGSSPHNVMRRVENGIGHVMIPSSLAIDCAFGTTRDVSWEGDWESLARIAETYLDLEWGGRWRGKKKDRPHFQLKDWKAFAASLEWPTIGIDTQ